MNVMSEISIIIPVYNRAWCVARAVESAARFVGHSTTAEIVLVDDGSVDSSLELMRESANKCKDLANISFRICRHERNRGVCAAKNTGARAATGKWLVFFDSDDELMPDGIVRLQKSLSHTSGEVIHFFTAIGEQSPFDPDAPDQVERRDFRKYLLSGSGGEALPVVNRELFLRFPYDEDIRGYESLAYMRLVKHCGSSAIHSLGLRRYHTSHTDRLSTKTNTRKRRWDLFIGHFRALREHYLHAPLGWSFKQAARSIYAIVK
jgi:glycosyltransferase involved in cell wall biosynthesis